jgi:GTP cyclohydrolase II
MPLTGFRRLAEVNLPTQWANFRLFGFEAFHTSINGARQQLETALALVLGDLHEGPPVVRIHSRCTTGDAFHSLRCDCHDQLHLALRAIAETGSGVLVYENQEGRGIGLIEKLRAYALQDQGLDTVEANLALGFRADERDYGIGLQILQDLGVRQVRLLTNNPKKTGAFMIHGYGLEVVDQVPIIAPEQPERRDYLAVKRDKLGHVLPRNDPSNEPAPG